MPVYEAGYRAYAGPLRGGRLRFIPVVRMELRELWRRRRFQITFLLSLLPCFFYLVFLYSRLAVVSGSEPRLRFLRRTLPLDFHMTPEFYASYLTNGWLWIFLLILTTAYGTALIAREIRGNALDLVFSRPVTGGDYILGKVLAAAIPLGVLTAAPVILLYATAALFSTDWGFLRETIAWFPRVLGCAILMTAALSIPCVAVSSLTPSALFAGATWVVLYIFLDRAAEIASAISGHTRFAFFGFRHALEQGNAWICGMKLPYEFEPWWGLGFLGLLVVLALLQFHRFLRKHA